MRSVYTPLLAYRHSEGEEGAELIPGLADSLPRISADRRTYTLHLRPGMRYSDGTPIRASDFRRAVERLSRSGSRAAARYGDISAISTDDRTREIEIRLERPRSSFANDLASPLAAPLRLPARGPASLPLPSSGPFAFGRSGYDRPVLVRNEVFERTIREAGAEIPAAEADRVVLGATGGLVPVEANTLDLAYIWMNTQAPPFNDARVRQAVNHAIDRQRIVELLGGRLDPGEEILPEGMPGHETLALYQHDLDRARELITEANPLDTEVTVWTVDRPGSRRVAAYYRARLADLGLDTELRLLQAGAYGDAVGRLDAHGLDTGVASVEVDVAHPDELLRLLEGGRISARGNPNLSRVDVPEFNARLAGLRAEDLERAEDAYAELDRELMEQAVWAPLGQVRAVTLVSEDVDAERLVFHPLLGLDLTSLALER